MRPLPWALAVGGVAFLLAGCNTVGPQALRTGRGSYSQVLQQTNNEQFLLNLVRLRYSDTPVFLEVSNITTSFDFGASAGASLSAKEQSINNTYGANLGVNFAEHPSLTYSPMQSEKFAKQLLSPISTETLFLLSHSGWSLRRVFVLCVQRLNGLKNAPRAAGPTPTWAPPYKDFMRAAHLMRVLHLRDALSLEREMVGNQPQVCLRFEEDQDSAQESAELRKLLGIHPTSSRFPLTPSAPTKSGDELTLATRSVLASMYFLSQGVEVPKEDFQEGRVTQTKDFATQGLFDWREVLRETFRVRCQDSRPSDAAVAVSYRGHWFFIEDNDLDSKSTFSLLMEIFALQAGDTHSVMPVLTIPVR